MSAILRAVLRQRLVVVLTVGLLLFAGLLTAPFDWDLGPIDRSPVAVDAIPDIGEAQQIVATPWPGRSPQDIEDQVTYPLTVQLLGIPGVRTVRSTSMFGMSFVNVIIEDTVDFYWARARILEKLASLPPNLLPPGVVPSLGPDATALGQVFWYTLEGRSPDGAPTAGWSLHELRTIQDFQVAPALASAEGVSEVGSIGGYVKEYQIDVDPDLLRHYGVTLDQVVRAVRAANRDVGARTIEINQLEYLVRGLGTVGSLADLEAVVVRADDGVPLRLGDVANLRFGPALRRGALDKDGAEAVGGVVVVRYGSNPMAAIKAVKAQIALLAPGLPERTLDDGTVSRVTVVPFYDRTRLIDETLATLESALTDQVLVTILVIVVMLMNLRASILVSALLPMAVLITFVLMRLIGVEANVVALAGIAIAIGTMVDLGIVVVENVHEHLERAGPTAPRVQTIREGVAEVAGAVLTAVATTIVSFLPVFGLEGAEGKLFTPLAWTKTLALVAAAFVAIVVLPAILSLVFPATRRRMTFPRPLRLAVSLAVALACAWLLAGTWAPLGLGAPQLDNLLFVVIVVGGFIGFLLLFRLAYEPMLRLFLRHPYVFLLLPMGIVFFGFTAWQGAATTLAWLDDDMTAGARARMPPMGAGFLPDLDEGDYLYMPSTMPQASLGATLEAMRRLDRQIASIPEVEHAVGKLGRAESALDPAPVTMIETVITVRPEWGLGPDGERVRQWRPHIRRLRDIWDEILAAGDVPGLTSAPPLQPIRTRIVMLQSGMRGDLGVRVQGPSVDTIQAFGLEVERVLATVREVTGPRADRGVGKPYLEIVPDRAAIARYGLAMDDVQQVIEVALGGMPLTRTIEGREGFPVRVRYPHERRMDPESIERIMLALPGGDGAQVPLGSVAEVRLTEGPQMIRSEDTFKVSYVPFGAAVNPETRTRYPLTVVVDAARAALESALARGDLVVPDGVIWDFAGDWEQKQRSDARLMLLIPIALVIIVILLQLQFRSVAVTGMVFAGVFVAIGGGFLALWAWGQPGFLDFELLGRNVGELLQVGPVELTVGVWVGFIALIGIAVDDGVVMATYLRQRFAADPPTTRAGIIEAVVDAGKRRIRPCLMTTATTVLALLPVLTSTGKGADVMLPMAIPVFGGMLFELVTLFVVPVLYGVWQTLALRFRAEPAAPTQLPLPLEA